MAIRSQIPMPRAPPLPPSPMRHFKEVCRDRGGDAAFLRSDTGICSLRIDQTNDGETELLGEPHLQQCLAIPFRVGAAEVACDPLFQFAALVVPDEQDLVPADAGERGDDRPVVPKGSIPVQHAHITKHQRQVVGGEGSLGVPRYLNQFPRSKRPVQILHLLVKSPALLLNVCRQIATGLTLFQFHLLDIMLNPGQRLLKVQKPYSTRCVWTDRQKRRCLDAHG